MRNVIGIDPGAHGAIAYLLGERVTIIEMPTVWIRSGRTDKKRTDTTRLLSVAKMHVSMGPERVVLEQVWGVKGQAAATGAALGHQRACCEMAYEAAGMKPELVSSQRWKGNAGLYGKDKAASIALAIELFPADSHYFKQIRKVRDLKQCEGNAEAALIARFG